MPSIATLHNRLLLLGLSLLLCSAIHHQADAQLIIAPTSVFLDDSRRIATFMVINKTNEAREIDLSFAFGYPTADSTGTMVMLYNDTAAAARFSLTSWVKVFPRKFVLQADQKQYVRLMARPPQGLAEGNYWGRLLTSSSIGTSIASESNEQIGAELRFTIDQVVPVLFRKGDKQPDITIIDHSIEQDSQLVLLQSRVECNSNPPFYGTSYCRIYDSENTLVHQMESPLTVYFDAVKNLSIPRSSLPPGTYSVEFNIDAKRAFIDERFLLDIEPQRSTWSFTIDANPNSGD